MGKGWSEVGISVFLELFSLIKALFYLIKNSEKRHFHMTVIVKGNKFSNEQRISSPFGAKDFVLGLGIFSSMKKGFLIKNYSLQNYMQYNKYCHIEWQ